jgi:hypothetical protein
MKKSILLLSVAVTACAMQWAKPEATREQADQDEFLCEEDARYYAWRLRPIEAAESLDSRGRAVGRGPYPDERRLAYLCMRNKGYHLESARQ